MTYKILIVDDEPANLRLLARLFRGTHHVFTAPSGEEALELLSRHDMSLLITDQRMPGMTGIELLKRAAELRPHMVRIILTGYADMGALVEAINSGEVYKYITKPWRNGDLKLTVERALEHYETNRSRYELELANQRLQTRLQDMTRGVARAISEAMEARDEHVYGHSKRVSGYVSAIGRRLWLNPETLESLSLAAFLHDVGKIGTPDRILLKPSPLSKDEREILQQHPERGARILSGVPEMEEIARAVRHHHEHFDGSGYPDGLCGEQIPLASRIINVADAYDDMTSPRPFREAFEHKTALQQLKSMSGYQFDPEIVNAFLGLEELGQIRESLLRGFCGGRLSNSRIIPGNLTFEEMVKEVETEPTLAAAVLRQVNAGVVGAPLTSLGDACARLDRSQLEGLLELASVTPLCGLAQQDLWEHSMRCALATRLLAEHTGLMPPEEAYSLGLLHDIGEVLLRTLFPQVMENILWLGEDKGQLEREVAAFGVDHAQVGQWILDVCGLPRSFTTAVQMHHDAARACTPAAVLLIAANAIAKAKDSCEIAALDEHSAGRLEGLGLNSGHLARLREQTSRLMEVWSAAPM